MASNGTEFLVVWATGEPSYDLYGVRVDEAGTLLDPVPMAIAVGANGDLQPRVVSDGTNFLLGWHRTPTMDQETYDFDRVVTAIAADGTISNPDGVAVGDNWGRRDGITEIDVVPGGYMVWDGLGAYRYGWTIDAAGAATGAPPVYIGVPQYPYGGMSIEPHDDGFLVMWAPSLNDIDTELRSRVVDFDGNPLGPDNVVSDVPGWERISGMKRDGTEYVATLEVQDPDAYEDFVEMVRLDAAGPRASPAPTSAAAAARRPRMSGTNSSSAGSVTVSSAGTSGPT